MVYGRVGTTELLGRTEELGVLAGVVKQISDPVAPTCVVVTGEAGVGKSRLLSALADHASASGVRVLRGACLELSEALPYGPFLDVLDQLEAEDGVHSIRELAGRWVGGLGGVLPAVGPVGTDAVAAAGGQQQLFQAVTAVLIGLGRQRPAMVLIEDLQWADRSTLDLLTLLVYRAAGTPLLVVASVRDEGMRDDDPALAVIASLQRSPRALTLPLSGLGRDGVEELMARIRGHSPLETEVARVHELTGGNPFLIEELLDASDLDEHGVPTLARRLLRHRLGRLDGRSRRVVTAAAVGGARVDQNLLARVAGRGGQGADGAIVALREAVDAGLLTIAGDQVGFRHALLREAALSSLLAPERSQLHADWAAALVERPDAEPRWAARVAQHWVAAGELDKALPALVEAAAVAERLPAHAEASRLLDDALDLWDRCPDAVRALDLDRRELLERAVTAAELGGRRAVAARRLRETILLAEPMTDASTVGRMYARLAMLLLDAPEEAIAACERARQLVPADPPSAARAYVLTQEALVCNILRVRGAVDVGEEALDAARRVGDQRLEAAALVAASTAAAEAGLLQVDDGVGRLERAMALAASSNDQETQGRAYNQLSWLLMLAGQLADAYRVARDGMRWAERVGRQQDAGAWLLPNAVWAALLRGRWDDGVHLLALPGWEADSVLAERTALLGEFAVARGDFARADELLRPALQSFRTSDAETMTLLARPLAAAHLWRRRPAAAIDVVDEVLRTAGGAEGTFPEVALVSVGLQACADLRVSAAVRRDRVGVAAAHRYAAPLLDGLARRDASASLALAHAHQTTAQAEAARLENEGVSAAWSAAVAAWERIDVPYEAAYGRWRWAEALLAEGCTRSAASDILLPAARIGRALGARPLVASIAALATRARLQVDAAAADENQKGVSVSPFTPLGLTPREDEVLRRLAAGYTNQQIADELFISGSTAGVHVSNILRKLGVSNRVQAAAIAHELQSGDSAQQP